MKTDCVPENSGLEATSQKNSGRGKGKVQKRKQLRHPYKNVAIRGNGAASAVVAPRGDDKDQEEIREYLNKLQELVPFMPKNKRLSKLTVISHVIEYIRELRVTLGLPPSFSNNRAFPGFTDVDMDPCPPSPPPTSVTMTMTMVRGSNGEMLDVPISSATTDCSSIAELVSTSLSGVTVSPAAAVPSAVSCTATVAKQQQQGRQPLGVILNPRNCATATNTSSTSSMTSSSQVFQKSSAPLPPSSSGDKK